MTPRLFAALLGLLLGLAPTARGGTDEAFPALRTAVLHADEARRSAMVRADTAALDALLVDDCLYVHSSGSVQTKPELLTALTSGALRYAVLNFTAPPLVRLYDSDTAVLTGAMELEVQPKDRPVVKAVLLVTTTYVLQQGHWRLASYQSTVKPR